jgi:hypothetical protein
MNYKFSHNDSQIFFIFFSLFIHFLCSAGMLLFGWSVKERIINYEHILCVSFTYTY